MAVELPSTHSRKRIKALTEIPASHERAFYCLEKANHTRSVYSTVQYSRDGVLPI